MAATGYHSNAMSASALEGEQAMNKMLVAVFDTEPAAYEGLQALKDLHRDGDITLYATAVLVKDIAGMLSVKQSAEEGPLGTAVGMLSGSAVGLLAGEAGAAAGLALGGLAGPVGAAIGLSLGGLTGLIVDLSHSGVNIDFVDEVSQVLLPGKAAVVAEVEESWQTPVDTRLGKLGGLVFRRLRSEVVEDQLVRESAAFEAELQLLEEELAQASAESKAELQKEIDAVKQKLEATRAQAEARQQQLKSETDAKVAALREQIKQASDRRKAQIERRTAEVKADYEVRSGKLEQARKLVKEALTS
jgi:uncharacterized membrane protein